MDDKLQLRISPGTAGDEPDHQVEQVAAERREETAAARLMRAIFGERFTLDPVKLGRAKRRRP